MTDRPHISVPHISVQGLSVHFGLGRRLFGPSPVIRAVEATGGIDPFRQTETRQRRPWAGTFRVGELGQDAHGFVEKN